MNNSTKTDVVVGAGLNGLVLARLLQKRKKNVVLVEAAESAGGLFRSWTYPEWGTYDCGVHIFQDTGLAEVESLIRATLPDSKWNVMTGAQREIAGLYYNGRLQFNSAFLDFRDHVERHTLFGGLLPKLNEGLPPADACISFQDSMVAKFGEPLLNKVIGPIVEGIYGKKLSELQLLAATLTPFHRVIFFDEKNMTDLMQSESIRARCGYPEQRSLPEKYASGLASYYPKEFGLQKVVDRLLLDFVDDGGALYLGANIVDFLGNGEHASKIVIESKQVRVNINDVDRCIWTAALPTLYKSLLGEKVSPLAYDMPPQTWILNLVLKQKPSMKDLYFFYSYLQGGNILRVSNPLAYSEKHELSGSGRYPICVEAIFPFESNLTKGDIEKKLVDELVQMKIFPPGSVCFSDLNRLPAGFPMPTMKNALAISTMRECLKDAEFKNIIPVGVQAQSGLFYYRDVLRYGYSKVIEG